jgi:enediyne biosynthesis protein E4
VLLRNRAPAGELARSAPAARPATASGSGARVTVEAAGGRQVREINNAASYQSANDVRLHIGLGTAKVADRIEIRWPSGRVQELRDVAANRVLVVEEP